MSGHISPENATRNPVRNERGNTTRTLLLVLLLVVAAGGYLYYFTDLIRPKEAAKPAPVQTAQVKKPLPPRPVQPEGAAPAKPEAVKPPQGGAPAVPSPAAAKPAGEKKPAPAAPPAAPAPAKVAKVEAPAKPAPAPAAAPAKAPPVPVKPAPAPVKKEAAPAPAAKKGAAPVKMAAKTETPAVKAEKPAVKTKKTAVKRKGGAYTLLVGDFVPDPTFRAVQAKLKRSGIAPVRKSVLTVPEPMNRLFVAQFTDQDMAEAELQKLKKLTADAFLVADNGTYTLYAGSYFTESRTASELKRLNAKGIAPVVKKARIEIKVTRVTAGSYANQEDARKGALLLKKEGIAGKVIKAGK